MEKQFSTEFHFLLLCLQSQCDPQKAAAIQAFDLKQMDWKQLRLLIRSHKVSSLVYESLAESRDLPESFKNWLIVEFEQNKKRTAALNLEISYISQVLKEAGITPILLKGPLLSKQLFDKAYSRNTGDLDWLLKPEQIKEVYELLGSLGYQTIFHDFHLTEKRWNYILNNAHDFALTHPARRVMNEIHWCLDANKALFPESLTTGFFERAQLYPYGNLQVLSLSNEDLLLYLCYHGARHVWYMLRWLVDIHEILRGAVEINWDVFFERAQQFGLQYCVTSAFNLSNLFWGGEFPSLPWESDANQIWLDKKALESLSGSERKQGARGRFNGLKIAYYSSRLKKGKSVIWQSFKSSFINKDDWKYVNLPDRLFFLYVLFRPFLWVYKNWLRKKGLLTKGVDYSIEKINPERVNPGKGKS